VSERFPWKSPSVGSSASLSIITGREGLRKWRKMTVDKNNHSAEQFGPQRDFWWNHDFLDLMAARWRLQEASSLADIGCGLCHWSRLLYPYLRAGARFAGVDREEHWVAEAARSFRHAFPQVRPDL